MTSTQDLSTPGLESKSEFVFGEGTYTIKTSGSSIILTPAVDPTLPNGSSEGNLYCANVDGRLLYLNIPVQTASLNTQVTTVQPVVQTSPIIEPNNASTSENIILENIPENVHFLSDNRHFMFIDNAEGYETSDEDDFTPIGNFPANSTVRINCKDRKSKKEFPSDKNRNGNSNKNTVRVSKICKAASDAFVQINTSGPKAIYVCQLCGTGLHSWKSYKMHFSEHVNDKYYKCEHCSESFNKEINFILHSAVHDTQDGLQCPACKKSFNRLASLKSHIKLHEEDEILICDICDEEFTSMVCLEFHLKQHNTEPEKYVWICKTCLRSFDDGASYKKHMEEHMKILNAIPPSKLQKRKNKKRGRYYRCDVCKKCFVKPSQLLRHQMIHTGEKPYMCDICDRRFNQKNSLQTHLLKHSGDKPFTCKFCKATFRQKGNLKAHILRVHSLPKLEEKVFGCQECSCIFRKINSLNNHKFRVHQHKVSHLSDKSHITPEITAKEGDGNQENVRRSIDVAVNTADGALSFQKVWIETNGYYETYYGCSLCPKKMTRLSEITRHMKSHMLSNGYKCIYCSKTFSYKETYITHVKLHKTTTHYQCEHCSTKFSTPYHLQNHNKLIHGKNECNPITTTVPIQDIKVNCSQNENKNEGNEGNALVKHRRSKKKVTLIMPPYICQRCNREFERYYELKKHISAFSADDEEGNGHCPGQKVITQAMPPFICEHCNSNFSVYDDLKIHMEVHTQTPNNFQNTTSVKTELLDTRNNEGNNNGDVTSVKMDTGYNIENVDIKDIENYVVEEDGDTLLENLYVRYSHNFKCNECGSSFTRKHDLKRHCKIHLRYKTYICYICKKSYKMLSNCKKHMRMKHRIYLSKEIEVYSTKNVNTGEILYHKNDKVCIGNNNTQEIQNTDEQISENITENNQTADHTTENNQSAGNDTKSDQASENMETADCTNNFVSNCITSTDVEESDHRNNENDKQLMDETSIVEPSSSMTHNIVDNEHQNSKKPCIVPASMLRLQARETSKNQMPDKVVQKPSEGMFRCNTCHTFYHSMKYLKQHHKSSPSCFAAVYMPIVIANSFYSCSCCHLTFESIETYVVHIQNHEKKSVICIHCNLEYTTQNSLQDHMVQHALNGQFPCMYCGKLYSAEVEMKRHILNLHLMSLSLRRSKSKELLVLTNEQRSSIANQKLDCSATLSEVILTEILKSRSKNGDSLTSENSKKSKSKNGGSLIPKNGKKSNNDTSKIKKKQSKKAHKLDPPAVTVKWIRVSHTLTVSNTNLVPLPNSSEFKRKARKKKKQNRCTYCAKIFKKLSDLSRHLRTHTGEKPYKCEYCNKCFTLRSILTAHIKTHVRLNDIICHVCGHFFSTPGALKLHMLLHTGDKPYSCTYCNEKFRTINHRKVHEKKHFKREKVQPVTTISSDKNPPIPGSQGIQQFCFEEEIVIDKALWCGLDEYTELVNKVNESIFTTDICLFNESASNQMPEDQMVMENNVGVYDTINLFECGICSMQFKCKQSFLNHLKLFASNCLYCTNHFSSLEDLKTHLINTHKIEQGDLSTMNDEIEHSGLLRSDEHHESTDKNSSSKFEIDLESVFCELFTSNENHGVEMPENIVQ